MAAEPQRSVSLSDFLFSSRNIYKAVDYVQMYVSFAADL